MRRWLTFAAVVLFLGALAASPPRTGLEGGGGGGGGLTNSAGYTYPTDPAGCISVGDEAVPADKNFEACPNVPTWSEFGYDSPTTVAKWHTVQLGVTGIFTSAGNDRGLVFNVANWGTLSGTFISQAGAAIGVSPDRDLRIANYYLRVITVTVGETVDDIPIKVWGCEIGDLDAANPLTTCDPLGTIARICGSAVSGCTATAGDTVFKGNLNYFKDKDDADFYDAILIGFRTTEVVDADNDTTANLIGYIEYEN